MSVLVSFTCLRVETHSPISCPERLSKTVRDGRGSTPDTAGKAYSTPPGPVAGGEEACCPSIPKNPLGSPTGAAPQFWEWGYKYYCERSEQKIFGVVPPTCAILGGTTATKRGIRRAYRI